LILRPVSCNLNDIITPNGSAIVCGAVGITSSQGFSRNAEAGFLVYSAATGKVERLFGLWKVDNAGALASNVVWSDSTGSVLIGAIPDHGDGELGIISGNQFTPLALPPNTQASFGGTW